MKQIKEYNATPRQTVRILAGDGMPELERHRNEDEGWQREYEWSVYDKTNLLNLNMYPGSGETPTLLIEGEQLC